ncbi:MAG TPA: methylmalonyl-CoA mutase family protein [Bacteroidales bacterium]|nr:methylmalonyl-CoA mutase family protein [Bacteroidales bacterium]
MDPKNKSRLFDEFPPVSAKQWEEKILADLKGADFQKLIWSTIDGLSFRPYYRAEDMEKLALEKNQPGEAPFLRGAKTLDNNWEIRQYIDDEDVRKANAKALKALADGAEGLRLNTSGVANAGDLKTLLGGISLSDNPVHFGNCKNYPEFFEWLSGICASDSRGSLNFDPLGYYVLYNRFYHDRDTDLGQAAKLLSLGLKKLPAFRVIMVNGQHFHNAGGSMVQELSFALAQGNEYLVDLTQRGFSIDDIAPRIQFTLAVGSDYFPEIARLRAARVLWAKIVEQYHPKNPESLKMQIHAETSSWNKTIYDPYVNMLRTTTEAMAAALGGADSITVHPYDSAYKKPDEFSERIARNQQLVLKHESYFHEVVDPAGGSYYIEALSQSIGEAAWNLFREIEANGGFIACVANGMISQKIDESRQKKEADIARRKQVIIGVNQYPNLEESMIDKLEPTGGLSQMAALKPARGAQAFEALRIAVENHQKKGFEIPKVFLLTFGNLAMRKARAGFATNFFGVSGYRIIDNAGFETLEAGVGEAVASGASMVVFCSSDEEYAGIAPAVEQIKKRLPKSLVVVAGYPKELIETLDRAGVDHYIHLRTNILEALTHFNEKLGIA